MSVDFSHVLFISAGAGSGKTYRLTQEVERAVTEGGVDASRIIATTFTVKAAGELQDRVRQKLVTSGYVELSEQVGQALIGTVHSVCEKMLKRFAFELGLSPVLSVLSLEDGARLFNHALDETVPLEEVRSLNTLSQKLGQFGWQAEVKRVADRGRENDLSLEAMLDLAQRNAEDFVGYCPPPDSAVSNEAMRGVLKQALLDLDASGDATKKFRSYRQHVEDCEAQLAQEACPWGVWMSLAAGGKATTSKKSEPVAQAVREAASRYAAHPTFQSDVTQYIERIVSVAARTADRFRELKLARGLIDFPDMEREMLRALTQPTVVERLREELDLLLVDEFQDTNPLQLAIFIQLSQLAKRVIFVGDVKQAIYAFRGCDPDLVFQTLRSMTAEQARSDKLPFSWRSCSPLVEFSNAVFARAFAGEIPQEEVSLQPKRGDETGEAAVRHWQLSGRNNADRYDALAAGVLDMHERKVSVMDPTTELCRPVCWGDIAVLARTNDHVEEIARTLKFCGIPVKLSLDGLLNTPEVILARACLRRLNDPSDTIASAEVLALAEAQEPEQWLVSRLEHLQDSPEPNAWGEETSRILGRLAKLREESVYRSVVEIVARALNDVGARAIVTRWGPDALKAEQRQRNLDAFLDLAVQYERHCEGQHRSATLTGFLFWLEKPSSPELDLQPVVTSGDAVHVLTYHRSKGLEWPVVVACDLNEGERSNLWGVRMLSGGFELDNPLANRFLRYWPNIFGMRTSQPLYAQFEASEEGADCRAGARSESRRLAYVGLTRARDVLVFALPEQPLSEDAWLNALSEDGMDLADFDVPIERFEYAEVIDAPSAYAPNWYPQHEDGSHSPAVISPSAAPADEQHVITATHELGARLPITSSDMTRLGLALHAVIGAELLNPGLCDVAEVLSAYGVEGDLSASDAVMAAVRLREFVSAQWPEGELRVEYPVRLAAEGGQLVRGFVDLLIETSDEVVIVDHKAYPRPRSEWPQLASQYGGQLEWYAQAVAGLGKSVRRFLYLPVGGAVLEVGVGGRVKEEEPVQEGFGF